MANLDDLTASIRSLHDKVDRVLTLLESVQTRGASTPRAPKQKPLPLAPEDVKVLQAQFATLYDRWIDGHEIETQEALDQLDAEQLRRLADANNLNVTSKMPKQKVLHLIGARFREKKQLHKATGPRLNHGT